MIEAAISLLMLSMILGVAGVVSTRGGKTAHATEMQEQVNQRARRALDRIVAELTNAGTSQIAPDPGTLGTSSFNFRRCMGIDAAGNPVWSELCNLTLQSDPADPNDGFDNDGDGLVDERQVTYTRDLGGPNQLTIVLCDDVTKFAENEKPNGVDDNGNGLVDEPGFVVTRAGDLLTVRLSVAQRSSDGRMFTASADTSVTLRN